MKVPALATPLAWDQVPKVIKRQFRAIYGLQAGKALPYLLAMIALENARGASFIQHNWGNITTNDPADPYWQAPDNERMFLAFPSHEEGARRWLERLGSETHKRILTAALRDDFAGFFSGVTQPHPKTGMAYCPDCATQSAHNSYLKLVNEFRGKKNEGQGALKPAKASAVGVGALLALMAAWKLRRKGKR